MHKEEYSEIARKVVAETVQRFHVSVVTEDGLLIEAPLTYQIEEPGFRPYKAGKASPEDLQRELDAVVKQAVAHKVALGIEGVDSLRKLMIQMGLGVDCSNFTFRLLDSLHQQLQLKDYDQSVFRLSTEIQHLHETKKPNWDAKDAQGVVRELTKTEQDFLHTEEVLNAAWITQVFGKDSPLFIVGAKHIADERATVVIQARELLPGDLIVLNGADDAPVVHIGNVEQVEVDEGGTHISFWHAWHTRDFADGIRRDTLTIHPTGKMLWSHEGLANTARYGACSFRRSREVAQLLER